MVNLHRAGVTAGDRVATESSAHLIFQIIQMRNQISLCIQDISGSSNEI